jgi:O-antigen/teichoic acid export membrane protein
MMRRRSDSLTRGAALGLVSEAMILPTGIVSAAILTRTLGLDLYGLIGVAMAAIAPVAWFVTSVFGMRSTVKIIADAEDPLAAASALVRINLFLGVAGAVLFYLAAPTLAAWLEQPGIVTALRIGALEVLLMPVARAHRDALLGVANYGTAGIAGGVFHVARLTAVVILLLMGVGIETVVLAHVAGRLAEIAWCRLHLPVPLTRGFRISLPAVTRLVAPNFLNSICVRVMDSLDLLMLSALGASAAALGHYSAALMLAQLPRLVNLVVAPGLIVALSKAAAAGDHTLAEALKEDAFRLMAATSALILVAAGAAPTILLILFGREFVDGALVLTILLAGGVGIIVFVMSASEAVAAGKAWWPLAVSLPVLALNLCLLLWLVPALGAVGAATASAVSYSVAGLAMLMMNGAHRTRRARHLIAGLAAGIAGGGLAAILSARGLMVVDGVAGAALALAILLAGGVIDRKILARIAREFGFQRRPKTDA